MKFYRIAHQTIMSGLVVRYKELPDRLNGFEVSVSRDGIMLQGYSRHIENIEGLKEVLDHAQSIYEKLSKDRFWGKRTSSSDINATTLNEEPGCVIETRKAAFGGNDVVLETRDMAFQKINEGRS